MVQPQKNIVVRNGDIRKYFDNKEWREMSAYEREQTRNVLRNHLFMISCGIKASLPSFITSYEARQSLATNEQPSQNTPSSSKKTNKTQQVTAVSSKGKGPPVRGKGRPKKSAVPKTGELPPKLHGKTMAKVPKETTRTQPARLSKTLGEVFIKNSIKTNRRQAVV